MLYQNQNDETLVMLTLAGEQRAYEVLVIRYQRAVISSAAKVTHSEFMAEDAAQDAFVTAWMKLNTLNEPQKFGSWVCRIAKNCALNMLMRYRSFLPLDAVTDQAAYCDPSHDPAELYALSEEKDELHTSIGKLPDKVKTVICLHYFEGLSIAEIADRMRISQGTVKWQLHDGRKRIRKELCAMNEKYSDTLVQRVMKKLEELKLWQVKNDKSGFEVIYADVLREVEDLPESDNKYHALADVLMRGWWWLPGEKNDALFARIKDAAIKGKNDEVMEFIVTREDSHAYGKAKIDFIRDKQIPMLEEAGFVRALAREWFWLGYHYFRDGQTEKGNEAYDTVQRILKPSDTYYSLVPNARKVEKKLGAEFKDVSKRSYLIGADAAELRNIDGELRYWSENATSEGRMYACDRYIPHILRNSSRCDGRFFADLQLGESFTGTDGSTLCYVSDCETVETPCGTFEECHLFTVYHRDFNGISEYKSYYKSGVGIVKHSHTAENITDERLLKSYHIEGGEGLLPLAVGNSWEYTDIYPDDVMRTELRFTVTYADEGSVIVSSFDCMQRLKYDESSWLDMIEKVRNEYWQYKDGKQVISDVSDAIERANALAKTPMEKAHAEAAGSVARRIMDTDPTFNPGCKATGHWNFFAKNNVYKKDGAITVSRNFRWSFEWKGFGAANCEDEPLLFNDVYGILMDAANCIWSDEWRIGATPIVEYNRGAEHIRTQITCEDGGSITTKAGTFDNCLKLSLIISDRDTGLNYRGGNKEYYFAEGIGIVRTVNEYRSGARKAVYDLVSYKGTAEGYMPIADGLMREYEAIGTTDGYIGGAKYTYVEEDGQTSIFADRTGIRVIPAPTTSYGYVLGEEIEDKLNDEGKLTEAHLQHAVNNFNIMLHYLARPARHRNNAVRSIGICAFNMNLIESFGDGEVPPAWLGVYVWASMIRSAALFGNGDKEEGYKYLDCAIGACERWNSYDKGDLLATGNEQVFGGVKLIKGKEMLLLPDGTREPASYSYRLDMDGGLPYSILTMPSGWEWFNSVREEERFKKYIDRAYKQIKNG